VPNSEQLERLSRIFQKLGVPSPESYARSEMEEGIPQLAIVYFLYRAFACFVEEGSDQWIKRVTHMQPDDRCSHALRRILRAGIDRNDLTDVVRFMQHSLLKDLIFLIDDNSSVNFDDPEMRRELQAIHWRLFRVDEGGTPTAGMDAMHELLDAFLPRNE
jgi:hypothetical protein